MEMPRNRAATIPQMQTPASRKLLVYIPYPVGISSPAIAIVASVRFRKLCMKAC